MIDRATEQTRLKAFFEARYIGSEVSLTNYREAASGASNETRILTLNVTSPTETRSTDIVVRWAPANSRSMFEDYDIGFQSRMMKALAQTAVPVPRIVIAFDTDSTVLGGPFVVMEHVSGEVASDYPPGCHGAGFLFEATPEQREHIWWRSLEVMATINQVDWRQPAFAFMDRPRDGRDALTRRLALFRRRAEWLGAQRIEPIARALDWLENNIPDDLTLALCWSDGRPGNIIFRDFEPVAALDWEGAYIGPPENDLALFILVDEVAWRVYGKTRLVGLPDEQATICRYEEMIGRKVRSFDYFMAMQALWLALILARSAMTATAKGMDGYPEEAASDNFMLARLERYLPKSG